MSRLTPERLNRSLHLDLPELDAVWAAFRDHADPYALRTVLDRLGPRLFDRCWCLTADRQLAEDALQDALVRLYAARHRLRTYPQAVAWLYRTASNAARQIARGRRRADRRERRAGGPTEQADATAAAIEVELAAAVSRAVVELPENERRVIELVYFERMTHADAAAALGWSRGSVGTYVARGLRRLREGLSRRGVAVAAGPALATALGSAPPARAGDWAGVLPRVFAAADAAPMPLTAGGPAMPKRWLTIGLPAAIAVGAGLVIGVGWLRSDRPTPPSDSHPTRPAEAESLAAQTDRLFRRDVLPDLLAELTRVLPPDNPPRLVSVRSDGPRVECEFATTKAFLPATKPTGLRLRYCTVQRRMEVFADLHGNGGWKAIDPRRPIIFDLAIPGLGLPAWDMGHQGIAFGRKAFGKLPVDERAEAEFVRLTFGEPGAGLTLPPQVRAVTGDGGRLFVTTQDDGLFARLNGRWRYLGECRWWFLATAGDRLYANGISTDDGVWSRSADAAAGWEKVGDLPAEDWKQYEMMHMAVAGGRVHYVGRHRVSLGGVVWSRPLADPKAGWRRDPAPVHPRVFTGAGDWLYGMALDRKLVRRAGADPTGGWEVIGRVPDAAGGLFAVADQLWWFDPAGGPIAARPVAGTDEPWRVIGRVGERDSQR